jgi:hypothetical protein
MTVNRFFMTSRERDKLIFGKNAAAAGKYLPRVFNSEEISQFAIIIAVVNYKVCNLS